MTNQNIKSFLYFSLFIITQLLCFGVNATNAQNLPSIITDIKIKSDDNQTKVLIYSNGKIDLTPLFLDEPKRLILEGNDFLFKIDNDIKVDGLIKDVVHGRINSTTQRMIFELSQPVGINISQSKTNEDITIVNKQNYITTIELRQTNEKAYQNQMQSYFEYLLNSDNQKLTNNRTNYNTNNTLNSNKNTKEKDEFVVLIDPGHGGIDSGAISNNDILEKEITLHYAKLLEKELNKNNIKVFLTRSEDIFIPLRERRDMGNKYNADLFISIHADSFSSSSRFLNTNNVRGASIYTFDETATDEEARIYAEKENKSDELAGITANDDDKILSIILNDLKKTEKSKLSIEFANFVYNNLQNTIKFHKSPIRQAAFTVLSSNDVPSILFEIGFLTSEQDLKNITNEKIQNKFVKELVESIEVFKNYLQKSNTN